MRVNVTLDGYISYILYHQGLGEPLRHNPFYVGMLDRVKRTFKRVLFSYTFEDQNRGF